MNSRYPKGRPFFPDLRLGRGPEMRHPDRPQVVLHHEHDGELPQRCHVEAFEELAIITGAVAKERYCDIIAILLEDLAAVLGGESGTGGDWDALADKGEAADEVALAGEHVHGAALATTASSGLPEKLRHDGTGRDALAKSVDVIPVGADDCVASREEPNEASGDRFLAVVEVDKAKHLAAVVHLGTHVLESAPQHHVFVQIHRFFGGDRLRKQKMTENVRSDGGIEVIRVRQCSVKWIGTAKAELICFSLLTTLAGTMRTGRAPDVTE